MSTLSSAAREVICRHISSAVLFAVATLLICAAVSPASAQTFTTLHSFTGSPDGASPFGGLVADRNGNYYGTSQIGGTNNGTVFELTPPAVSGGDWTETVIWSFAGGAGGKDPSYQLVMDAKGRLYGETQQGGNTTCACGIVFVLVPPSASGGSWTEHTIYTFTGARSSYPYGGIMLDSSGAVYGTQHSGGTFGSGLAFKIAPVAGGGFTATTLYNFGATTTDSIEPFGPLTMDASGNLYGVSFSGGANGEGTVYELTPPATGSGPWSNSVLHSFALGASGCNPDGNLILDKAGRLYGQTTACGGGYGVIFRLTPIGTGSWAESLLHTFTSTDGGGLYSSLSLDFKTTVFYGTSFYAGGYGVVFELTPPTGGIGTWTDTVLHTFTDGADGGGPLGPMVWDASGVLYGTAFFQNDGWGTAFSITP